MVISMIGCAIVLMLAYVAYRYYTPQECKPIDPIDDESEKTKDGDDNQSDVSETSSDDTESVVSEKPEVSVPQTDVYIEHDSGNMLTVNSDDNIECGKRNNANEIENETDKWKIDITNDDTCTILHNQTEKYLNVNLQLIPTPYTWCVKKNTDDKYCVYDENENNVDIIDGKLAITNDRKYAWTLRKVLDQE